jgi:predicted transcriptional regulator of viral defense system
MIITIEELKDKYNTFGDIQGKIRREVNQGKYIPIVRGLYETNKNTPGYYLSSYIYGPSYLSFDYALSYYGLIPERVNAYTSATYNKSKSKTYFTPYGTYIYRDIPNAAFPLDINAIEENDYVYFIASKEKAICDKLYSIKSATSIIKLKELLFENLRIDRDQFALLDRDKLALLSKKYPSRNLSILEKLVREMNYDNH